ncbi:MAG: GtrA family protein [Rhodocyclaceae bacterium]|nr:GtrA family protein [Rhodocyclaceae bacterium]
METLPRALQAPHWLRIIRFIGMGGAATLAHWAVMLALIRSGGNPVTATVLGSIAGAALNYVLQHRHTFSSPVAHSHAFPRYLGVCALAWFSNLMLFTFLHFRTGVHPATAQLLTTLLVSTLNYQLYKRMVFHGSDRDTASA